MISRDKFIEQIGEYFDTFKVVAILGPRQCGKSTLSRQYMQLFKNSIDQIKDVYFSPSVRIDDSKDYKLNSSDVHYFDLENERDLFSLKEAQLTLESLKGLIIIDEIQRKPELFPLIRYLVDYFPQKYLILGSASRDLIRQSSETLAGRIGYKELTPFSSFEIPKEDTDKLWWRGGFPQSFLASSDEMSHRWRTAYIQTFLQRDLAMMGIDIEPVMMERFWQMLAFYHGQTFHPSSISNSLEISHKTVQRYVDILEGTFMVRQLRPWAENINKRQVRSNKIYIRDSGLLHTLWDTKSVEELRRHPKIGASWEGFALEEIIKKHPDKECYFWSTQSQSELDLLIFSGGKRYGFEFKYSTRPTMTKSMHIVMRDLNLEHLSIITPGDKSYPLSEKISVNTMPSLENEKNY